MENRWRGSVLALMMILLTGCVAPRSYITFEILEPAPVTFPKVVEEVAYLNRAPKPEAAFDEATLMQNDQKDLFILDTIIVNGLRRGFLDVMQDSPLDYLREPVFLSSRRNDTTGQEEALPAYQVRAICDRYGSDALISQEYYGLRLGKTVRFNWSIQQQEEVYALLQEVMWRVYLPDSVNPLDEFRIYDTLFYVNYAEDPVSMHYSPTEMIRDAFYSAGEIYGSHLVPLWIEISRPVFRGRETLLKKAAQYTDAGEWEKARELWAKGVKSDNTDLVGKSAHNLAIYYELEDELEQALMMAELAFESWDNEETDRYYTDLQLRVRKKEKVLKQVH